MSIPSAVDDFIWCHYPAGSDASPCIYCGLLPASLPPTKQCPAWWQAKRIQDAVFRHTDATVVSDLGAIMRAGRGV